MPQQIRYDDGASSADARPPAGCLLRLAAFAGAPIVLAAALYAVALAMSRSPVFRAYLADEFSVRHGLDFTLQSASLAPNLDIVVRGLSATSRADRAGPELSADGIRLAWSWRRTEPDSRLRAIVVAGGRMVWPVDPGGGTTPTGLPAWIASWISTVFELSGANAASASTGAALDLRQCSVSWRTAGGGPPMEAAGVHLRVTPLAAPGRRMVYANASAERLRRADGTEQGPVNVECVFVEGQRIDLTPQSRRGSAAEAPGP